MLNPKMLEVFGEESRLAFNQLLEFLGEDYAKTCYVFTDESFECKGIKLPMDMMTTDREHYKDLRMRAVRFMDMFTANSDKDADVDESEIYVFVKDKPDEEHYIPLWVPSENQSPMAAALAKMSGE